MLEVLIQFHQKYNLTTCVINTWYDSVKSHYRTCIVQHAETNCTNSITLTNQHTNRFLTVFYFVHVFLQLILEDAMIK